MNPMETIARVIIGLGLIVTIMGVIFFLASKLGMGNFRLPGDIIVKKGNFTFFFPVVTCIIISIVLSIILNLFGRR
ncbi:MAG: DUF2905 domain-containing protein [Syntrophomonadaceae bacterium]|nr:DUF2905 domain-containing protein [Syntrophomonadaceae bacterium]